MLQSLILSVASRSCSRNRIRLLYAPLTLSVASNRLLRWKFTTIYLESFNVIFARFRKFSCASSLTSNVSLDVPRSSSDSVKDDGIENNNKEGEINAAGDRVTLIGNNASDCQRGDTVDPTKNNIDVEKGSMNGNCNKKKKIESELIERIEKQEVEGGRMRASQLGVLHEDPNVDMRLLMENYTVASLASALRDREDVLQQCASYALEEDWKSLQVTLRNYHPKYVLDRRKKKRRLALKHELSTESLELIRKALSRMPRSVTQPHASRAGVVVALCLDNGIPSVLLEKRSPKLRAHPDEVCLPGGMVCSINDTTIVSTCLREMKEEITGLFNHPTISVLGVLRCNWGEVHHLVGVAVTPVVCYLGELPKILAPNTDEVAEVFTIPLASLLENNLWVHKDGFAPIFVGGKHYIWGLTGYILDRFVKDILLPHSKIDTESNKKQV